LGDFMIMITLYLAHRINCVTEIVEIFLKLVPSV
jgi:hypothetical protein